VNTVDAVRLVAARELRVKLRDKTFILSTVFFLLFAVGGTIAPALLSGGPDTVAVADRTVGARLESAGFTVRTVADDAVAEQLVRSGAADAAVVAGPKVLAMDDSPGDVVRALSTAPPVQLLDPQALDPFVAFIVPFALAFIFFFVSFTFGLQIAQSVTEEKQTRIVEILVSSVPIRALLAGKVAAMTLLAFGQIVVIAAVTMIGLKVADVDPGLTGLIGPAIGWFLPFFVLGFVMLATLWAGVGALVTRQEDLTGASMPLQIAIMVPFLGVLSTTDNPAALKVLSYVPFSSPIAMPIRMFDGDAAGWEALVSLALLTAAAVVFLAVGARVYEGSLLRTNGRTSLATAWRNRAADRATSAN
jgi:ABC-2 type transport system permease protein